MHRSDRCATLDVKCFTVSADPFEDGPHRVADNRIPRKDMSMNQTTASGENLTLLCEAGRESVDRRTADAWLRQRQAARTATRQIQRRAS